jgi:hypothetical protein
MVQENETSVGYDREKGNIGFTPQRSNSISLSSSSCVRVDLHEQI